MIPTYDAIVVGAGIHGLCTAFWLHRLGCRRIAVVERFGPGHVHGSSHGATRITRSSYHEPAFVRLAARAHREGWPVLEQALGRPLRVATPGLFFGPADGPFRAYVDATLAATSEVETIAVATARSRFPLLRIDDGDAVLLDRSAAVVLAEATMDGLRAFCAAAGVALHWDTRVVAAESHGDSVRFATSRGELRAGRAVLAAGPWLPALTTPPAPQTVLRQEVGYFAVDAATADLEPGAFPVWARIGAGANDFQYGLPSLAGAGLKLAQHATSGPWINADAPPHPIDEDALRALARSRLARPVTALLRTERCLYTMTPDHGFDVATLPHDPRIVTIAACSGHGFKFGPVIGRMAAELALR